MLASTDLITLLAGVSTRCFKDTLVWKRPDEFVTWEA